MSAPHATAVYQLAEALDVGDGVTSIVRRTAQILAALGEPSGILARRDWVPAELLHETRPCHELLATPVPGLVFHYWGRNSSLWSLYATPGPKAIYYHNVTPPRFFGPGSLLHRNTSEGYVQLAAIANDFDLVIGDSRFNLREFARYLRRPRPALHVYPTIEPDEERDAPLDDALRDHLRRGGTNVVFVGRLARNKRPDDVIRAFDAYRTQFDPSARCWLVGNDRCDPEHRAELDTLCRALPSGDAVTITGKVSDAALRTYVRTADVLVSASEHEGFCIPVAQAMALDVPVVARAAAAVPETLDGGGVLFSDWDPRAVAAAIHRLRTDGSFRGEVLVRQRAAATRFSLAAATTRITAVVQWLRRGTWSPLLEWLAPPGWPGLRVEDHDVG